MSFQGQIPEQDEELSPTLECDVVADWLEALGGPELLEHIFQTFAKDLERESLADLRQRISDSLESLQAEVNQQALVGRVDVLPTTSNVRKFGRGGRTRGDRKQNNPQGGYRTHIFFNLVLSQDVLYYVTDV